MESIAHRSGHPLKRLLMNETIPLDEMVDGRGGVRQHWRRLLAVFSDLGHRELAARKRQIAVALSDQTGSPLPMEALSETIEGRAKAARRPDVVAGQSRPLICDPLPIILRAEEFAVLEAGVIQRVRLAESLLRDVYGERETLALGLLPPALLWANSGFMRGGELDGEHGRSRRFLSSFAVDVVREQDGVWRVLAEQSVRPDGAGVAMEARRQMVRVAPEFFSGQDLRRLGPFLDIWQESLQRAAPEGLTNPGLALLTPGPHCRDWGEHVILARELGCVLVEAGDLAVREGELWLKTVRGLRRVDVLLVRQDGRALDPLEPDGTGAGGVTGLLDAARAGTVRLVNDPRSGFVEAPGLAPFLAPLANRLLGENLLLENTTSVWLGDEAGERCLDEILHAGSGASAKRSVAWKIGSALDPAEPYLRISELGAAERAEAVDRIRRAPWRYVAHPVLAPSVAPTVGVDEFVPRPVTMRLFAVHDGEDWTVMPGGLASVYEGAAPTNGDGHEHVVKDVWVLVNDQIAPREHPVHLATPLPIRRSLGDLPSRAADDFFWLGRYLEQIDSTARLLRVVLAHMAGGEPSPRERVDLETLVRELRAVGLIDEIPASGYGLSALIHTLSRAMGEQGLFGRILRKILRLVPELSDRLTREMRDFIIHNSNDLLDKLAAAPSRSEVSRSIARVTAITDALLVYGATLSGLTAENMVRSGGRQFLDLGRRIERASLVLSCCAGVLEQPGVHQRGRMEAALRLMLEICDSVITYRSRYFGVVQPAPVLDLLLLDADNPRGAGFQLAALRDSLGELANAGGTAPAAQRAASGELSASAAQVLDSLTMVVASVLANQNQDRAAADAPEALRSACASVLSLSDQIGRCYFSVLTSPRLVGIIGDDLVADSHDEALA